MDTVNYYDGPFDPHFELGWLSRSCLARLGREYMLFNHLHDRSIMPIILDRFGMEARTALAVDEWRGSSPVYGRRLRDTLKIKGKGLSAIFKTMQNDVGAPHHFLDFRFELVNEELGYFWAERCGPYECTSTVTGGDPAFVKELCHDMEDTTFPSTTMAVNPKAHCLPIHRPPLPPGHTGPPCRWEVSIKREHHTLRATDICRTVALSKAARFEFPYVPELLSEGMEDYGGPFKPDYELDDLSHAALVRLCKEFTLDVHLLIRACMISIASRWGADVMKDIAREEWLAAAPVYVARIRRALRMEGDDVAAILKMLQVDPSFPHNYVDFGCRLADEKRGYFWINQCAAVTRAEPGAWLVLLSDPQSPGFEAALEAVNPLARCRRVDPAGIGAEAARAVHAWEITIDDSAKPRDRSGITPPVWVEQLMGFTHRSPGAGQAH